jgi:uncharacterized protein with von Willebrand factor type A (vWA) domain
VTAPERRDLFDAPLTGPEAGAVGGAVPSPAEPSPTALVLDRWGRRRGDELAAEWQENADLPQADAHVTADALASLFDAKPALATAPADRHRAAWWRQLLETPEYRALHAQTVLSPTLSRFGAAELARQWITYAAEEPDPNSPSNAQADDQADGGQFDGQEEDPARTIARIRSTRAAAKAAAEQVETARATAAGLGLGDASELDPATVARYVQAVRNDGVLRAIMAMAGRYRARAQTLQRERVDAHRAEITGIELAGDVGRLLPTELLAVAGAVPELEMLALYRLATRRCLAYRHHRRDPVGMGPIVVSVDESGSMAGEAIAAAKGLALAMAWIARQQRRPCLLVGFSGTAEVHACPSDSPDDVIAWCRHFWDGGTVLDGPLATVPTEHWPLLPREARGRADHIIITDAEVDCPDELRASYRAWAERERVRTYGLVIGASSAGDLAQVADRCWCLPDLSLDQTAIEAVLSIGED